MCSLIREGCVKFVVYYVSLPLFLSVSQAFVFKMLFVLVFLFLSVPVFSLGLFVGVFCIGEIHCRSVLY